MGKVKENALVITEKFPAEKYNLLVPIQTVAEISDIQKPVLSVVYISTNLDDKEIYEQEKAYVNKAGEHVPPKYAISKKGLTKLMRAAGIKMISSESLVPSTCQKCANINASIGKPVHCGACPNKDVKFRVTISVPSLTGEDTRVIATKEIIVADVIADMKSDKQVGEFLKFRSEICEAKALNRALREAMQIKGTYLIEELEKPFVVAYLVPNLDNEAVKAKAIDNFFASSSTLFGPGDPTSHKTIYCDDEAEPAIGQAPQADIPQIEVPVPEPEEVNVPLKNTPPDPNICTDCGAKISDEVSDFSIRWYKTPLCRHCQDKRRGAR